MSSYGEMSFQFAHNHHLIKKTYLSLTLSNFKTSLVGVTHMYFVCAAICLPRVKFASLISKKI